MSATDIANEAAPATAHEVDPDGPYGVRLMHPYQFGAAVRGVRAQRGMTLQELADACGVSRKWLSEFERGKASVEFGLALNVFRNLGFCLQFDALPKPYFDYDEMIAELTQAHGL